MTITDDDLTAIWLTLRLAVIVTVILLVVCTPLAWWLARGESRLRAPVSALVALPLVLPPTVLGFYLLIAMGPEGAIGAVTRFFGLDTLAFSFSGLVIASLIYSLPFVVQPLQGAFARLPRGQLEAAATLGARPLDRFFTIALPQSFGGYLAAGVLGFAHTVGEFGVVLMIGGNLPGETQVVSVQIYEQVESLNYEAAHGLAAALVLFSFIVLLLIYRTGEQRWTLGR